MATAPDAPGATRVVLVVAAALCRDGKVLLAQRPPGRELAGMFEYPGGKVEPGERPEASLCRELQEELGITVAPADLAPISFASHSYPKFHLLMPLYAVWRWTGEPIGLEGQALRWAAPEELGQPELPMPEADYPLTEPVRAALAAGPPPLRRQ